MQPTDKPTFMTVLAGVHDFYGRELSEFAAQVWWQAAERFDVEQVTKAMSAHLMDPDRGQFAPKPADMVRVLQGTRTDRALLAWGKVYHAMTSVGAYQSVAFDDASIHNAVDDIGGWVSMCRTLVDELPFVQKRFCEAYRMHAEHKTAHPARLIGACEQENQGQRLNASQRAWLDAQTVLIGDEAAVRAVIASGGTQRRIAVTHLARAITQPRGAERTEQTEHTA